MPLQVQSASDIEALRNFLDDCGGEHIRIIAKIETVAGLRQFDEILGAVCGVAWSGLWHSAGTVIILWEG